MTAGQSFTVTIKRSAEKDMDALPPDVHERIARAILVLEMDPRRRGSKKLRDGDKYRIRVGAYRVLYVVDDRRKVVEIVAVGHRREIYKDA